jgi:putative ABC transport system permease protein
MIASTARALLRAPGFTFVAVLALALGIGANCAIFSVIETIFLRPLPFADPGRLVVLSSALPDRGLADAPFSWPRMRAVRERQQVFAQMAVSAPNAFNVSTEGDPEQVRGLAVSHDWLPLLGVRPLLGRNFLPEEDRAGGPRVALLGYAWWQGHYGGRPDAVGETITLDGQPYTIIGVLPRSLSQFPLERFSVFVTQPGTVAFLDRSQIDNGGLFFNVIARLKPGVDLGQARAAVETIAAGYAQAHPANVDAKATVRVRYWQDQLVGDQARTCAILFAAVAALLLIACANVANLLLARFSRRRKEIAIRFALGARRRHVVFEFLRESLLVSLAGGVLGLALAAASLPLLAHAASDFVPRAAELSLDPLVVAFTFGVSILAGIALGVIPALHASMHAVNDALKDSSRETTSGERRGRFRNGLLVGEIAVSFVLLVAAALLISSFVRLRNVSPGFRSDGVFSGFVLVPPAQYPARTERTANFYRNLYHRLESIPGARSVALSDNPPLSGNNGPSPYAVIGRPLPPLAEQPLAIRHLISPGRFKVLGIPIVAGRDFNEHDTPASPPVMMINQAMARALFPGENPLGRTLITGMAQLQAQIVGVVADVHTTSLAEPPSPEMYYPVFQRPENFTAILIRTDLDPHALTAGVRAALRDVAPGIPLIAPGTLDELVSDSMADRALTMGLLAVFAALALVLATVGVYSVMAYSVTQRSSEIGIRMALGARAATVQRMVVWQGARLALLGIGIGLALALALTRLMRALLFEVQASDPVVYLVIAVLLGGVAVLACWVPARRASRIDPIRALHVS